MKTKEKQTIIRFEHVSKRFGKTFWALKDINFDVYEGDFISLIGLSGSGKSTLLRLINGLIQPTEGKITFLGEDITHVKGKRLRQLRLSMGMVFQQHNLVKRASVLTNVLTGNLGRNPAYYSLINHFPKDQVQRAYEHLDRVGIASKAMNRATELSGGQQQRVAIARTLMQQPKVILADEPVASLDPATSHSVMKYLKSINRDDGLTVLCSLHFLSLIREYSSRVIALKDGIIRHDGGPHDIDEKRFKEIYGEDAVEVEIQ